MLQADVKYVGGIAALHQVAQLADMLRMQFSPHNQAGPVQTMASVQVLATLANAPLTEISLAAPDLRQSLIGGVEILRGGNVLVSDAPGLGVTIASG